MRRRGRTAWVWVMLAACGPSAARVEGERILAELDRVSATEAPLADRSAALAELREEAPRGSLAADARRACIEAYGPLLEAHAALDAIASGPKTPADAERLAEAERSLAEAKARLPACQGAQGRLRISIR